MSDRDLFRIDGEEFETREGTWVAKLLGGPRRKADSDEVRFEIEFLLKVSDVRRRLDLVVLQAPLEVETAMYVPRLFLCVDGWLNRNDPPRELRCF